MYSGERIIMEERPKLVFAAPVIGCFSEVWMWRQLVGFNKLEPNVLTWQYKNADMYPLDGIPIQLLCDFNPKPTDSPTRWFYRARCLPQWNFYATIGEERKRIEGWIKAVSPSVILAQFGFMGLRILPIASCTNARYGRRKISESTIMNTIQREYWIFL